MTDQIDVDLDLVRRIVRAVEGAEAFLPFPSRWLRKYVSADERMIRAQCEHAHEAELLRCTIAPSILEDDPVPRGVILEAILPRGTAFIWASDHELMWSIFKVSQKVVERPLDDIVDRAIEVSSGTYVATSPSKRGRRESG